MYPTKKVPKILLAILLSLLHDARGSKAIVMQPPEDDCATHDASTRDQNRKLTQKGKEYMIEALRHHRDAANGRLAKQIKKVNTFLEEPKDMEILTSEAEELDSLKKDLISRSYGNGRRQRSLVLIV